jgi:ribonuclease Z
LKNQSAEISELTELAHEGSSIPLTNTPIIGKTSMPYGKVFIPGTETLAIDEIRVTILGSGDPFVKRSQAAASVLVEVGNPEKDVFIFDLGSGSVANLNSLGIPVTASTKVFLSHLHADHVSDLSTLLWSNSKSGRRDPVEVWGPAGESDHLGTRAFMHHLQAAFAWDTESMRGHPGQSGTHAETSEVPFDRTTVVYQRNGVTITSFPVIHIHNGAVGYRLDYAGRSFLFSGDTMPCKFLVEACDGVDLLVHEVFPTAPILSQKSGMPLPFAEMIVNTIHTSPEMSGEVFKRAGARLSAMWHLVVDHDTVGPVFSDMRKRYDGPVVVSQDFTVFNITKDAVVTRQAIPNRASWPVMGVSATQGPPLSAPGTPPAWWDDAVITD